MNSSMQVREVALEVLLVVAPCQSVHTRSSMLFEGKELRFEQIGADVVQERGEPLLLPFLRSQPYAFQPLGHACPARRPVRVVLVRIPFGPSPSLHRLRGGLLRVVRRLPHYYGRVRLPTSVHHRLRLLAFPMRTRARLRSDAGPPRFRRDPSARDGLFDPGWAAVPRMTGTAHVAFGSKDNLRPSDKGISGLNHTPHAAAVYASRPPLLSVSRNTRFQAARYALPGLDFHQLIAPASWRSFAHPTANALRRCRPPLRVRLEAADEMIRVHHVAEHGVEARQ